MPEAVRHMLDIHVIRCTEFGLSNYLRHGPTRLHRRGTIDGILFAGWSGRREAAITQQP